MKIKIMIISSFPPKKCGVGEYSKLLYNNLIKNGIDLRIYKWNYQNPLAILLSPFLNIVSLISEFKKYSLIHVQYEIGIYGPLFLPALYFLKKITNKKVLLTTHESYEKFKLQKIAKFVQKYHHFWYKLTCDAIIVHTRKHRKLLVRDGIKNVIILPHGIPKSQSLWNPRGNYTLILPGFINWWKGHDIGILAMKEIVKQFPNAKLIIAGYPWDLKFYGYISNIIKKNGLEKNVILIPKFLEKTQLIRLLTTSSLCILPYREITMSGILALALSVGVPLIVSDLETIREFCGDNVIYFEKENAKNLSRKVISLFSNKKAQRKISRRELKFAEAYSWYKIAEKHLWVYKKWSSIQ